MDLLVAHGSGEARRVLAASLEGQDIAVVEAADGTVALDMLKRADAPRLALVEWDLPGLDGLELCRLARDLHPDRPPYIILLTPAFAERDMTVGLHAGASDFMFTPVRGEEVRARVAFGRQVLEAAPAEPVAPHICDDQRCFDALTGLCNRATIVRRLEEELARSRRDRSTVGIGILDVDGLERVSASSGRETGDDVLREVARRLKATLRPYDGLGRLMDEEFLIITPRTAELDVAEALNRVRSAMAAEPFAHGDELLAVTVTVGGATGSEHSAAELMELAVLALNEAKEAGGDRVVAGAKAELDAVLTDRGST
jgi:diguanylate cyclase (GGDEF)-like protein